MRKSRVWTIAEWRAIGLTAGQMRTLARSGDLVRVRKGVYATRTAITAAKDDERRGHILEAAAVIAAVGRGTVVSHHSAAVLHRIDLLHRQQVVTLTRPPATRRNRPKAEGIFFHAAELPPEHVGKLFGMRVTTAARTVVDLARTSPFMAAVVAADSALRADKTTKAELTRVCDACRQWPGVTRAREVIEFSDGAAGSVLESCARVFFRELGLDPPELQVTIHGDAFAFRVDFYWPRHRTIAEADGLAKYASRKDILEQFRRDRLLREAGYKVVHFTWRELFDAPETVVAHIRAAFSSPTSF